MPVEFTKMQGLGNDFLLVDTLGTDAREPGRLARALCSRRLGVGADGLILLLPPTRPDAHLRILVFNADGSPAETCGNGLRCVARLALERGLAPGDSVAIETAAGLSLARRVAGREGSVIRVDMGAPLLQAHQIPVHAPGNRALGIPIPGMGLEGTCVSMGNPHVVIFCEDLDAVPLGEWGPRIERAPLFPKGVNVHFAQVLGPERVRAASWERGVGATPACGSGACAICVAGVLEGRTGRALTVVLPGGSLQIEWEEGSGHLFMTGPAETVFTGSVPDPT